MLIALAIIAAAAPLAMLPLLAKTADAHSAALMANLYGVYDVPNMHILARAALLATLAD